ATQQVAALTGAIAHQLPRLAIPSAVMALYEDGGPVTADSVTRLVLNYDAEPTLDKGVAAVVAAPGSSPTMPAVDLLPALFEKLARRASIVVEPLFFHDRPL